ncbi:nucleolar protein dao-5-like isoform X4 [Scomber scombrus]|uniref:Nucleolar protein dao-5-like isoform X4 n=1 Tax=Scomber scombrus TaxID=13677 RepID=A0AAV1PBW7_SCOSC
MKTASEKSAKKDASTRSNGTNMKNADLKTDDNSDNEPLKKMVEVASKTAKKPSSVPLKKSVETKKEAADDDVSSDDDPVTEVAKKIKSQHQAKSPRKANLVTKSKRNSDRKKVKYAESSSDNSDYEPQ